MSSNVLPNTTARFFRAETKRGPLVLWAINDDWEEFKNRGAKVLLASPYGGAHVGVLQDTPTVDYLAQLVYDYGYAPLVYIADGIFGDVLKTFLPTVCECGSEKAKLPTHSSWCPKYEP